SCIASPPARGVTDNESRLSVKATSPTTTTSSNSLMQLIRACWWAAEKPGENPSRPNGAWPGLRNTTSSAIKLSKQTRSPALTASIQVECTSRIARSSGPICNLCRLPKELLEVRLSLLFEAALKETRFEEADLFSLFLAQMPEDATL